MYDVTVGGEGVLTVILLPLRPASLMHKNSQGHKIIHGTHLVGRKERSIDRSIYVCFKSEIKPTSSQIKRVISSAYKIGQELISERINRSISSQILQQNFFYSAILIYLMEWLLIIFTIYGKHMGEPRWPTIIWNSACR